MTKKHFTAIAKIIDEARMESRHDASDDGFRSVDRIAREFAGSRESKYVLTF